MTRRWAIGCSIALACALAAWAAIPKPDLYAGIAFSTLVTDRNGTPLKLLRAADGRYRLFTLIEDIAPVAQHATLLYEDRRFRRHPGVDPAALVRAAWTTYVQRTRPVGGSTITMQLARLRFALDTRTLTGKLVQAARALQIERHYGKDEILEAYLNLAPYGGSIEGIGTASRIYFDKPAGRLNLGEALALVVIPQNPVARLPATNQGRATLLAARDRLLETWLATRSDTELDTAARARIAPAIRSPSNLPSHAPHFVRDHVVHRGTEVRSTLDLDAQRLIEERIRETVDARAREGINNAAAILVDRRAMEVRALVGSAGFFHTGIAGQVNGVRARRSPGSTLKPLIYGLALDHGLIHPMTLLEDAPRRYAAYTPENFDRGFMGPVFARDALIHSRNVPAVGLLADLGVARFRDWLRDAGVGGLRDPAEYGLALALGGAEVTMEELAKLYAMLAAGGVWRELATAPDAAPADGRRLLSPEASYLVLDMLRDVPRPRPARLAPVRRSRIAWKTGTSFGFRDAWSVGLVGDHVLAVWVGNFDGSANPAFVGREAAAPLFFSIADSLGVPDGDLWWADERGIRGPGGPLNLRRVDVCATTGDLPGPHCPRTTDEWFIPGVSPIRVSSVYRPVRIDTATGLRSCRDDDGATERIYEFWPSNLQAVFRRAGISIRRPPPYAPGCALDVTAASGIAPRIRSPQSTLVYHEPVGGASASVLFSAVADGDARTLFWFLDDRYVARATPAEGYLWTPKAGSYTVRVVDDLGRADAVSLHVDPAPLKS